MTFLQKASSDAEEFSEVERYELREPPAYQFSANRREFNEILGAALAPGC